MSQEELGEQAGVSVRTIGDLERGLRTRPYRRTVGILAKALDLRGPRLDEFVRLSRQIAAGDNPLESDVLDVRSPLTPGSQAPLKPQESKCATLTSSVGIAEAEGRLALDDPALKYYPELAALPRPAWTRSRSVSSPTLHLTHHAPICRVLRCRCVRLPPSCYCPPRRYTCCRLGWTCSMMRRPAAPYSWSCAS